MRTFSLRRVLGTTLAALALATTACGSDDSSGPATPPDVSGSYSLTRVKALGTLGGGGNGLPVTFTDGSGSMLTFIGGQLALNSDGSYTLDVEAQYNGGDVSLTDEGVYQVDGVLIDFDPTGDPKRMVSGTVSGAS